MFKVIYLPTGYEYTVYFVRDRSVIGVDFLVYDCEYGGWKWLNSENCRPSLN